MNDSKELRSWFVAYLVLDKGELSEYADITPKLEEYVKRLDPSFEIVEIGWKTLSNCRYLLFKTSKPMPTEEIYDKGASRTPEVKGLEAVRIFPSLSDFDTENKVVKCLRRSLLNDESNVIH